VTALNSHALVVAVDFHKTIFGNSDLFSTKLGLERAKGIESVNSLPDFAEVRRRQPLSTCSVLTT
jgi:hypothetical protein